MTTLSGLDPFDPTPTNRREIILGAGTSGGADPQQLVMLYGNKTSAGTETVDTVGTPIVDENDAIARFGRRSELRWHHRIFRTQDTDATVHGIAVTEASGGTSATCTFTIGASEAAVATADSTVNVEWGGFTVNYVVKIGDTTIVQAAALVAAINNAEEGGWPMTATQGTTPNQHVVTVSAANIGDRGTYFLTPLRVTVLVDTGNAVVKSAVTNGSGTDDFTAAYAAVNTAGEFARQVSPKTATGALTSTDNGAGEHISNITTQGNPTNGKGQFLHFGLVGTNAQAITTATSANSAYAKFFWQKNAVWSPGMLAAYHAGLIRREQMTHPAANLTNYTQTDNTPYVVPPAYSKSDWASAAEIKAALNNGVCPIRFVPVGNSGRAVLVRDITSRSLNASNSSDYRCREGHIPYVMEFTWKQLEQRYDETKQPFLAADLKSGQTPRPNVMYPAAVKMLANSVVDDLSGVNPLGLYRGPILDPGTVDLMKASFKADITTAGGGGISFEGEFRAVVHAIKSAWKLYETSAAQ